MRPIEVIQDNITAIHKSIAALQDSIDYDKLHLITLERELDSDLELLRKEIKK